MADGPDLAGYWRSRWRRPSISMLWTFSPDIAASQLEDEFQISPWPWTVGQQQDCEVMYCDADGNPLSGWSGFNFIVP
jgi:hypothetical protein